MATLKTDYKNDIYDGEKQYEIREGSDGKSTITDVTQYTTEGDTFGAEDINKTNAQVNENTDGLKAVSDDFYNYSALNVFTLTASGWKAHTQNNETKYSQALTIKGLTANDVLRIALLTDKSLTKSQIKAANKVYSYIYDAETAKDQLTIYGAFEEAPTTNIQIMVEGMKPNG